MISISESPATPGFRDPASITVCMKAQPTSWGFHFANLPAQVRYALAVPRFRTIQVCPKDLPGTLRQAKGAANRLGAVGCCQNRRPGPRSPTRVLEK